MKSANRSAWHFHANNECDRIPRSKLLIVKNVTRDHSFVDLFQPVANSRFGNGFAVVSTVTHVLADTHAPVLIDRLIEWLAYRCLHSVDLLRLLVGVE